MLLRNVEGLLQVTSFLQMAMDGFFFQKHDCSFDSQNVKSIMKETLLWFWNQNHLDTEGIHMRQNFQVIWGF